jgi:DNA-binding Lrp family transcriptional regulator
MRTLDETDKLLLTLIQRQFPLVRRPYALLGHEMGVSEHETLRRTNKLREEGPIRQISAIFNTRSLGYRSTLAAFRVLSGRLESAAQAVSAHPGVSHNYSRDHEYNLWFTIAVPPTSRLGLERTVEILGREVGALSILLLPTIKTFKIGVTLDMTDRPEQALSAQTSTPADEGDEMVEARASSPGLSGPLPPSAGSEPISPFETLTDLNEDEELPPLDPMDCSPPPLTAEQIELVKNLQEDIPAEIEPFGAGAGAVGLAVKDYLLRAQEFVKSGHMRRFAAVLHHREAGFVANAMGVWAVPEERIEEAGRIMASFQDVSHCYQRPTYAGWPYSLFTMVHARTPMECERIIGAIAQATGIADHRVLYSVRDFKKMRVKYFTPEIEEWERSRTG